MTENYQEEKLRQEILGDARTKAERTVARARNEAAKNISRAKDDAARKREARLAEAETDIESKCKAILLDVARESRRHWLLGREACIDEILQKALQAASQTMGDEHARSMALLAEEAMRAIGPAAMTVIFPAQDCALVTQDWLQAIASRAFGSGHSAVFTLNPQPDALPGIIFATDNGQRTFDNTYASRLAKMKDELRLLTVM
ncbi:MAG: hypothetical protein IJS15_05260 [Victivallales bacterium]|nr:hypothetical protein [Victivallales bacterium]